MIKPSAIETITGHPVTTIVANGLPIVAAMFAQSVTPWLAMVPVCANSRRSTAVRKIQSVASRNKCRSSRYQG